MDIISTSAVATIIQAVSAALMAVVSAKAGVVAAKNPTNANRLTTREQAPMICSPALSIHDSCPHLRPFPADAFWLEWDLQRVLVGLAGADAQHVIDRRDENLAVADLAGAGARGDDVDDLVGDI